MSKGHAREQISAWADDYNTKRPHSSLDYATLTAFADELEKQGPASLRPTDSATQPHCFTRAHAQQQRRGSSRNWMKIRGHITSREGLVTSF